MATRLAPKFQQTHGLSVQKPGASSLALAFEAKQFAGDSAVVNFIAAIGDGGFQIGDAGLVDRGLTAQSIRDFAQFLRLVTQVDGLPAGDRAAGPGGAGGCILSRLGVLAAGSSSAGQ